jgi:hypothetical protein|tara:strand:+ start:150 stop:368 length:219 start_codon:yes stop_codon:yes gene_type:complete
MQITKAKLRKLILETMGEWEGASRPATSAEMEYLQRLKAIRRSRDPEYSVESRLLDLEAKVAHIFEVLGGLE